MKKWVLFSAGLFIFLIISCTPETPASPNWDTNLKIPLINDTFSVSDLADSTTFEIEDDQIAFVHDGDLEAANTPANMNINSKTSNYISIDTNTEISGQLPINEENIYDEENGLYETFQVSYGEVALWYLMIETQINDPLDSLKIVFEEIYDENGNNFEVVYEESFNGFDTFNLTNYIIGSIDNEQILENLNFNVFAYSNENQTDIGHIRVFFKDHIYFSYFEGNLKNKTFPLMNYAQEIDIEYPDNLQETLLPQNVQMKLEITNRIGFDIRLFADMTAYNTETGDSVQINFDEDYSEQIIAESAASVDNPTTSTVVLTESIDQLIEIFPNSMELKNARFIAARAEQNDPPQSGFADSYSVNEGTYTITAPFSFILYDNTIIPKKIFGSEITEQNQDYIDKYLISAELNLELLNRLPVGAAIDIYMSTENDSTIIFHPEDHPYIPSLYFTDAQDTIRVNSADNSDINNPPVSQMINLKLTETDMEFFQNDSIYTALKYHIDSTNDQTIYVKPSDFVTVKGELKIKAHLEQYD